MTETRSINYIKQTRAKIDRCNICGRMRELTWDHVPPKATLYKPNVYASTVFSHMMLRRFVKPLEEQFSFYCNQEYSGNQKYKNNEVL